MEPRYRGKEKFNRRTLALISCIGLVLYYLTGYSYTRTLQGADSPGCRIVYMGPSYARIRGFDESYTRLASKYSLYLYREQGHDPIPDENGFSLNGIPILFIPGNAGSFRQVRSIAAETSDLYFEGTSNSNNPNSKNFDFFSADFNEDFTAFHGTTMLEQAEYVNDAIKFILSLYENTEVPPKSVIILGHSMGGVVARVAVTLPNYNPGSMNTILTLASPHSAAPLTFDGNILKIYSAIDRFWYEGFQSDSNINTIASERLRNMSLVSITGGLLDSVLPADYTTLGFLVPLSNGFTVFTTGIPNVWTPVDHLAIVWCGQLRHMILETLLGIADYSSPEKTYPLQKRMKIMRQNLLSGFEDYSSQDFGSLHDTDGQIYLKVESSQINLSDKGNTNIVRSAEIPSNGENELIMAFKIPDSKKLQLALLSTIKIGALSSKLKLSVLLCKNSDSYDIENYNLHDFRDDKSTHGTLLKCVDVERESHLIPKSSTTTNSISDSSFGGEQVPFFSLKYNETVLSKYDTVIVTGNIDNVRSDDFIISEVSETRELQLGTTLSDLLLQNAVLSLPTNDQLALNIRAPEGLSSILAYKLKITNGRLNEKNELLFAPFVRQWSDDPFEVKWHINLDHDVAVPITMHGMSPYTPFKLGNSGLNIEFWSESNQEIQIELGIDWFNSLRLLVLRYRLSLVAFCVLVTLMVLFFQFEHYFKSSQFPCFLFGLAQVCSMRVFISVVAFLSILGPLVRIDKVQIILNMIDPVVLQDSNEINLSLSNAFKLNSFFLGLQEDSLWFVGPIFFIMSIGLVSLTYYVVCYLTILSRFLVKFARDNQLMKRIGKALTLNRNVIHITKDFWVTRQMLAVIFLLLLVLFYVPYQFAFVVCCVAQAIVLLKVSSADKLDSSLFNYQFTLLMLMLWILPISIPTLIVFVHNISISWKTPFSSHRNILSILPILMVIGKNHSMKSLPKLTKRPFVTQTFIVYFIAYAYIYGVRHTYWLHHLLNILFCWLLILYLDTDDADDDKNS
ncbi:uncharacterized protein PRCAT00005518001 [Priceomyces carsonii]|uniref:uncharacterized protein n=1 Tax=Priceomyces carsonii TaxID=28549 RepID=UPI002EDACBC8|nr:unnamed protein product [Priceomyces carsonii]